MPVARPLAERFWEKVDKSGDCWLWTGSLDAYGYGEIKLDRSRRQAKSHRQSWVFANGPIPPGMSVLHRCDVRACVRPDHLFLGTARDNVTDALGKRRLRPWGRPIGQGKKLTADQVREIRASTEPARRLAARYGLCFQTVYEIKARKIWRSVA